MRGSSAECDEACCQAEAEWRRASLRGSTPMAHAQIGLRGSAPYDEHTCAHSRTNKPTLCWIWHRDPPRHLRVRGTSRRRTSGRNVERRPPPLADNHQEQRGSRLVLPVRSRELQPRALDRAPFLKDRARQQLQFAAVQPRPAPRCAGFDIRFCVKNPSFDALRLDSKKPPNRGL